MATRIQRCACGKKHAQALAPARGFEPEPVQRRATFGAERSFDAGQVHPGVLRPSSGGAPLPGAVQARMEAAFGHDFSNVRVHHGPEAESIGAAAFTRGTHLHFAPGRYQPHSAEGQRLIGHELAHVVQQRAGRVARPGGAVPINANPALEREADAAGARAARLDSASTSLSRNAAQMSAVGAGPRHRMHIWTTEAAIQRASFTSVKGHVLNTNTLDDSQLQQHQAELSRAVDKGRIDLKDHLDTVIDARTYRATATDEMLKDRVRKFENKYKDQPKSSKSLKSAVGALKAELTNRNNAQTQRSFERRATEAGRALFGVNRDKDAEVRNALTAAQGASVMNEAYALATSRRVVDPENLLNLFKDVNAPNADPGHKRELLYLHKHGVNKKQVVQVGPVVTPRLTDRLRFLRLKRAAERIQQEGLPTVGADAVLYRPKKLIKFVQHKTLTSNNLTKKIVRRAVHGVSQLAGETNSGEHSLSRSHRVVHLTLLHQDFAGPDNQKVQTLATSLIPEQLRKRRAKTARRGYNGVLGHHVDEVKIETKTHTYRYAMNHKAHGGDGDLELKSTKPKGGNP